jgi:hypothetical protein
MDEQSKQLLSQLETETENRIVSTWNYRSGIPVRAFPMRGGNMSTPEEWKQLNPRLVELWVPINYDASTYDPLRRVVKQAPIRESDIPSKN